MAPLAPVPVSHGRLLHRVRTAEASLLSGLTVHGLFPLPEGRGPKGLATDCTPSRSRDRRGFTVHAGRCCGGADHGLARRRHSHGHECCDRWRALHHPSQHRKKSRGGSLRATRSAADRGIVLGACECRGGHSLSDRGRLSLVRRPF